MTPSPKILLLTGERQVGKTTALTLALSTIRQSGLTVAGLLTRRVGPHDLEVSELHTGAVYKLTDPYDVLSASPLGHFKMNVAAMARSSRALAGSFPTQVFVLDELGPLEFKHRQGWVDAFKLLAHASYAFAVVVVRPSLLGQAVVELPDTVYAVLQVTLENRAAVSEWLANTVISGCAQVPVESRKTAI